MTTTTIKQSARQKLKQVLDDVEDLIPSSLRKAERQVALEALGNLRVMVARCEQPSPDYRARITREQSRGRRRKGRAA